MAVRIKKSGSLVNLPSGQKLLFEVANPTGDTQGGTATINGTAELTQSGTVSVQGGTQNNAGHWGKLRVRAKFASDPGKYVESLEFGVCAHPVRVGMTFDSVLSPLIRLNKEFWGAQYRLDINAQSSDSGNLADLTLTKISEHIDVTKKTGAFQNVQTVVGSFHTTTNPQADSHTIGGVDSAGAMIAGLQASPNSQYEAEQHFRFSCARCGIAESASAPVVGISGFRTFLQSRHDTATNKYFIDVHKDGAGVSGVAAAAVDDSTTKAAEVKD